MRRLFVTTVLSIILGTTLLAVDFEVTTSTELQDALTTARNNGSDDLIKVNIGVYLGNFVYEGYKEEKLIIQGGFSKDNDPKDDATLTILDGQKSGTVLDVISTGEVEVRNLTIQNGQSDKGPGGLKIYHISHTPVLPDGEIKVVNNIIKDNVSLKQGGGVALDSQGSSEGEGLAAYSITVQDNVITKNSSMTHGGGINIYVFSGGGAEEKQKSIHLINNTITENNAAEWGGGVSIESRTFKDTAPEVILDNNTITGNKVDPAYEGACFPYGGGGVWVRTQSKDGTSGAITLNANTISKNVNARWGGGALLESEATQSGTAAPVTLSGNIICENTAQQHDGGGLFVAVHSCDATKVKSVFLTHNTLSGNQSGERGGGVFIHGCTNNVAVYNNIVWGNSSSAGGDIFLFSSATFDAFNNDYAGLDGTWINQGNNINLDPLFVGSGDYHLQNGSPCIDTGVPGAPHALATDIDGDNRVIGTAPDMGADEYSSGPSSSNWPIFIAVFVVLVLIILVRVFSPKKRG